MGAPLHLAPAGSFELRHAGNVIAGRATLTLRTYVALPGRRKQFRWVTLVGHEEATLRALAAKFDAMADAMADDRAPSLADGDEPSIFGGTG